MKSSDEAIDISLDKERVKKMSMEEKIDVLIDISFINHKRFLEQSQVLFGTETTRGLCETVRVVKLSTIWLWSLFCTVSGAYFTVLTLHIMRP